MTDVAPAFLAALAIEETQELDERTLRRAYARQLKQIDIEAEPARFQALRETLDQALRWLALRDRARAAAAPAMVPERASTAAPPPGAEPAPAPPLQPVAPTQAGKLDGEQAGAAAFDAFQQRVATQLRDEDAAATALDEALADERLLNIDARGFFEWRVACLLANGWHAGHEHLLDPASDAFGWTEDEARLGHFGQVGALLAAANRERFAFHALPRARQAPLREMIARMRSSAPPDPAQLRQEVEHLKHLVEHYPNWLRIVAPVPPVNERFERWRQLPAAAQASPLPFAPSRPPAPPKSTTDKMPAYIFMALVGVLLTFLKVGGVLSDQDPAARRAVGTAALDEQAADAELERRQRQAEATLARIVNPASAPAPAMVERARSDIP